MANNIEANNIKTRMRNAVGLEKPCQFLKPNGEVGSCKWLTGRRADEDTVAWECGYATSQQIEEIVAPDAEPNMVGLPDSKEPYTEIRPEGGLIFTLGQKIDEVKAQLILNDKKRLSVEPSLVDGGCPKNVSDNIDIHPIGRRLFENTLVLDNRAHAKVDWLYYAETS